MFELSTDVGNLKELREGDFSAYDAIYLGDFSCPEYPNNFSSHAELLEAKAADDVNRGRAAQVVASVLDAMGTAKAIRQRTETAGV